MSHHAALAHDLLRQATDRSQRISRRRHRNASRANEKERMKKEKVLEPRSTSMQPRRRQIPSVDGIQSSPSASRGLIHQR